MGMKRGLPGENNTWVLIGTIHQRRPPHILLEPALEMCDPDVQAKKVMLLGHLLAALWTALDDPDARQSLAATCADFAKPTC